MREQPKTLFIETTTRCNLSCPMCVRTGPGWRGGEGDMPWEVFERLTPLFPTAGAVILNGMGEPLLHPLLPRMVDRVKQLLPPGGWCGLQTNGLPLTRELAEALAAAGLDVLCLSHDLGASLGHPGNGLERVAELLRGLERAPRLGVETVLMAGNAEGLPDFVDQAAKLGCSFLLVTHLLPLDADAEAESLFEPCSGASMELYARWRAKAEAAGLDLSQAGRAALRHLRSQEDERLVELARGMREEALEQGLWLNMKRLALADPARLSRLARLEELFGLARQRAQAAGLDLRLPALAAPDKPQERRCPFVASASAFIDWRGEVSPCHFLWHGYDCRMLGDPVRVWAVRFGNVLAADPGDIWRGGEFASFRREVRAAEYPACGDCGTALCSDVTCAGRPFEGDCLGAGVPCGICPWALGQLMCLGSGGPDKPDMSGRLDVPDMPGMPGGLDSAP